MKRLGLLLGSLVIALAAAEGLSRLAGLAARARAFELVKVESGQWLVRTRPPQRSGGRGAGRKSYHLHPAGLPLDKPAAGLRVFVFGGSTVYGMPYTLAAGGGDLSFASYLREELRARHPQARVEVINCGVVGGTLEDVRDLIEEALELQPDVFVVLSGENEFLPHALLASRARQKNPFDAGVSSPLRHSRLLALLARFVTSLEERANPDLGTLDWPLVESLLGPALHTAQDYEEILVHAGAILEWIREETRERGVDLVLATCASNLGDFEPSLSTLAGSHECGVAESWLALVREGRSLLDQGDAAGALRRFDEALRLDAGGAEAHFRRGQALALLDRYGEALAAFKEARDRDGVIRRAPAALNALVREVASRPGAVLCDVEVAFERASPHGIPGASLLVDHVHPNLDGVALIAASVRATIEQSARLLRGEKDTVENLPSREQILATLGFAPLLQMRVDLQIGLSYANLILLRHYDPALRYAIAQQHLRKVLDAVPEALRGDFSLYPVACAYLGGIHVVGGDATAARAAFAEAARYDADWAAPLREFLEASAVLRRLFAEAGVTIPSPGERGN
ncbi:MAG: tetratricopeptide repeat protein [Planctomycetota bacterium]